MVKVGVHVAILRGDEILLTRREDFWVWCLPGGAIDPGESAAEAAHREVQEELGLEVRLTHLVGVYSKPHTSGHSLVFAADYMGDRPHPNPQEVIEVGFFTADNLPEPLIPWHRQRVLDALRGRRGLAYSQQVERRIPLDMTREEIYRLRDASPLSPEAFFSRFMGGEGPIEEIPEVEEGADIQEQEEGIDG